MFSVVIAFSELKQCDLLGIPLGGRNRFFIWFSNNFETSWRVL